MLNLTARMALGPHKRIGDLAPVSGRGVQRLTASVGHVAAAAAYRADGLARFGQGIW